ncbi:uncharacterized protein LOC135226050 [Macrobrachium nipponense]|uniref:uncharacterized protein LOC135226050 n=1 Tax=Macrobrachium nipponense TaxID=159736 RepID=UPI0030C836F8
MVDATPDMSHTEQSTFILRYLTCDECGKYLIQERFLSFIDDNKKTGADISEMILKFLSDSHIPFEDCRGQGYDNGSNMSDQRNQVIQAQSSTVDIEVKNIEDLETELQSLKKKWHLIYDEAKVVAVAMNIDPVFRVTWKGKRKSFFDDSDSDDNKVSGEDSLIQTDEHRFKKEVFFKVIDTVCERLNKRYQAIFQINKLFGFLWSYLDMTDEVIVNDSKNFSTEYSKDISSDKLTEEILSKPLFLNTAESILLYPFIVDTARCDFTFKNSKKSAISAIEVEEEDNFLALHHLLKTSHFDWYTFEVEVSASSRDPRSCHFAEKSLSL